MSQEFSPGRERAGRSEIVDQAYEIALGKVNFFLKIESVSRQGKNRFEIKSCELRSQSGDIIELTALLEPGWKLILDPDLPAAFAKADMLHKEIRLPVYSFTEREFTLGPEQELPLDETVKREMALGSFWRRKKVFSRLRRVKETECLPIFERPEFLLTFLHERGHTRHPNNQNLPEDFDERDRFLAHRQISEDHQKQEEIDCWKDGLALFEEMKEKGFDFGERLKNENVEKHVVNSLRTYGIEYDEVMEKMGGVFVAGGVNPA